MNSVAYRLTKNFNAKIKTVFKKNLAAFIAPDTLTANQLVRFSRFDFDLAELYARKIRKKSYEEKGAFTYAKFI